MKKIKILLLLLTVSVAGFYSCTDNDPVENEVVTSKSISLRTTLNEIKKANNINGKNELSTQDQAFCFNFVFPLNLSYNNGTVVTVSSYEGLIAVLTSETSTFYFEGIQFPFQVQQEGVITTIDDEAEFFALILDCNFPTVNNFVFDFTCYDIVYPISIINANNETVVIETQVELMQYVSTPTGVSTYQLNIVFPISIEQNGLTIVVNDLYEFFEINNDCAGSSCICTADFNPVCVETTNGTVMYSNACFALCDGFTEADFVTCNTTAVETFATTLGDCFTMNYPVQIQHQGALVTVNNDGELLQYYFPNQSDVPAFVYPVTINRTTPTGSFVVTIANQTAFWDVVLSCN
ncbi:hypothetical protein [Flavobacterium sp. 102]|uniref:hypothetical protein n=1 Tax=Flavobacterium sp. 102 TaxID=2135623 RepID=UPI000EB0ACF2|nr:hypothetical protein [Flavobacterium sp. 102]RKS01936.1 hypothetical protein C8C84_1621 [Flavobacterium sp. 102]